MIEILCLAAMVTSPQTTVARLIAEAHALGFPANEAEFERKDGVAKSKNAVETYFRLNEAIHKVKRNGAQPEWDLSTPEGVSGAEKAFAPYKDFLGEVRRLGAFPAARFVTDYTLVQMHQVLAPGNNSPGKRIAATMDSMPRDPITLTFAAKYCVRLITDHARVESRAGRLSGAIADLATARAITEQLIESGDLSAAIMGNGCEADEMAALRRAISDHPADAHLLSVAPTLLPRLFTSADALRIAHAQTAGRLALSVQMAEMAKKVKSSEAAELKSWLSDDQAWLEAAPVAGRPLPLAYAGLDKRIKSRPGSDVDVRQSVASCIKAMLRMDSDILANREWLEAMSYHQKHNAWPAKLPFAAKDAYTGKPLGWKTAPNGFTVTVPTYDRDRHEIVRSYPIMSKNTVRI